MIEPSGSAVRRGQECARAAGAANGSHVRNGFSRNGVVGTRSRLIRVSMSEKSCLYGRAAAPIQNYPGQLTIILDSSDLD